MVKSGMTSHPANRPDVTAMMARQTDLAKAEGRVARVRVVLQEISKLDPAARFDHIDIQALGDAVEARTGRYVLLAG
jgi:hypothetical protein